MSSRIRLRVRFPMNKPGDWLMFHINLAEPGHHGLHVSNAVDVVFTFDQTDAAPGNALICYSTSVRAQ